MTTLRPIFYVKTFCQVGTSPEKLFIFIASLFGLAMLFITPPFESPDEHAHFFRAYGISALHIVNDVRAITHRENPALPLKTHYTGEVLPKSLTTVVQESEMFALQFNPARKIALKTIFHLFAIPLNPEDRQFTFITHSGYPPVAYIPQALGILAGRLLGLPPIVLMYLGRICNLAVWIVVIYWAIRITPIYRWVFLLLALTPMSLFLAATLSGDVFTNGIAFLLTAVLLHLAFQDHARIGLKALLGLFVLSAMLALAKQIYLVLIFLYLLIPVKKIGSIRKYAAIFLLLLLVGGGLNYIWSGVYMHGYFFVLKVADPPAQIEYLYAHPILYLLTFLRTLYQNSYAYLLSFAGWLGWLDTLIPKRVIDAYTLILLGVAMLDHRAQTIITWKQKIGMLLLIILPLAGVLLTYVYIMEMPVGAQVIEGIQGRHFIPISPVVCLLFYNTRFQLSVRRFSGFIVLFACLTLTITLLSLVSRYYGVF